MLNWVIGVGSVLLAFMIALMCIKLDKKRRFNRLMASELPLNVIARAIEINPSLTGTALILAVRGFKEYMGLHILSDGQELAMPSKGIDDIWHAFLEHSTLYSKYCKYYIGREISHIPNEGSSEFKSLRKVTRPSKSVMEVKRIVDKNKDLFEHNRLGVPLLFAFDTDTNQKAGWDYSGDSYRLLDYTYAMLPSRTRTSRGGSSDVAGIPLIVGGSSSGYSTGAESKMAKGSGSDCGGGSNSGIHGNSSSSSDSGSSSSDSGSSCGGGCGGS